MRKIKISRKEILSWLFLAAMGLFLLLVVFKLMEIQGYMELEEDHDWRYDTKETVLHLEWDEGVNGTVRP